LFWWVWLVWAAVLFWMGRRHPAILDSSEVGAGRRKLGWIALAIFALCFMPAPISSGGL
jgi:hypothetical protein